MSSKTKRCFRCKKYKLLNKFSVRFKDSDVRYGVCIICKREDHKKYYYSEHGQKKRKEIIRKYRSTEEGRLKQYEANKKYFESEKGKSAIKRYHQSPKGRAAIKRANTKRSIKRRDLK